MESVLKHKNQLLQEGYAVVEDVYSDMEIESILNTIYASDSSKDTFRKSSDLFAIRRFLKEVPSVVDLVFNARLQSIISNIIGKGYFVVKSIYFDKPPSSNWYVAYHQDLTISVDKKTPLEGYGPWTVKQDQFSVQPPIQLLENITTIRIHLDETDENNGALKVVPGSHLKKIYRPETIDWEQETERAVPVGKGGIMLMKPLLLHSSGRTNNGKRRRVIHIELTNMELPEGMAWAERASAFGRKCETIDHSHETDFNY